MLTKKSTRSTVYDILVTVCCLAAAGVGVFLFVREFNSFFLKLNEEPIATVTYKYKAVQRKFSDRVLWDRPKQGSPLYNGDTIRTSDLSEATVHFPDGASFDLDENTIITIFAPNKMELELTLATGKLIAKNAASDAAMTVRSGNSSVRLTKNSELRAVSTGSGDEAQFGLFSGSGEVRGPDGSLIQLGSAESIGVSKDGAMLGKSALVASLPLPDARFLKQEAGDFPVTFNLSAQQNADMMLEISGDKKFASVRAAIKAVPGETIVNLPAGTWYWRVRDSKDGTILAEERFRVLDAVAPEVIAPALRYEYRYRTRLPSVRFIWSGNDYADYWELVIADNPALENPKVTQRVEQQSAVISSLGAGTWYWRVRPWYSISLNDFGKASSIGRFEIRKSGALSTPQLIAPAQDALVSTKNTKGANVVFSWKYDADAMSCQFELADNPDMRKPLVSTSVSGNVVKIEPETAGLANGKWYWRVSQTDTEGNRSAWSEVRSFVALDGELVQKLIFPPDAYAITENLALDTRFTWKNNLPGETVFQIAADPNFEKLQYSKAMAGSATDGGRFPVGNWYWRIVTTVQGVEVKTQARTVTIVPLFPKPSAIAPADNSGLAQFPGAIAEFSWSPVEKTAYYNFALFAAGNKAVPIKELKGVTDSVLSLDLQGLPEGPYIWTVQAMAEETLFATRRTGEIAEYRFTLRKLKPVELLAPGNEASIKGIDAFLSPIIVRWSSVEKPSTSRFILAKTLKGISEAANDNEMPSEKPVMLVENPGDKISIPKLPEGKYYWTIIAKTADGFNISPAKPRSFTVLPIPPLAAPDWMQPDDKKVFNFDYFKANRSIKFEWAPVSQATEYKFVVYDEKGAILLNKVQKTPGFVLEDLSILRKGNYRWTVQAFRRLSDGTILQTGKTREGSFVIDLPDMQAPQSLSTTNVYGK